MSRALTLALALTAAAPAWGASGQCTPFDLDPANADVTDGRRPDGGLGPDSSVCCKEGIGCERRCPNCTQVSQPVDTLSGFAWLDRTDLSLPQPWGPPVEFARHYATSLAERAAGTALGPGWTHTYSASLVLAGPSPAPRVWLFLGDRAGEEYTLRGGAYLSGNAGRTLAWDGLTRLYVAQRPDGSSLVFDVAGALRVLRTPDGGEAQLRYTGDDAACAAGASRPAGALCRVDFLFGRQLWFSYEAGGALAWVALDSAGAQRAVTLTHDPGGTLHSAAGADGAAETYTYGFAHLSWAAGVPVTLLLQATDADGTLVESFSYAFNHTEQDGPARVVAHSTPEASYTFAWEYLDLDTGQVVRRTRVRSNRENLDLTFANNAVASACFLDAAGNCDVTGLRTYVPVPGLRENLCEREGNGGFLRHERDALGRITAEYSGLASCEGVTPEAVARGVAYGYLGSSTRRVSQARTSLDAAAPSGFRAFTVVDYTSPASAVDPRCGAASCQDPGAYNAGPLTDRAQRRVSMGRTLVDPDGTWGTQVVVTTFSYDAQGRPATVDGPREDVADVATYQWSVGEPWALETLTAAGRPPVSFADRDPLGNPRTVTDEAGQAWRFERDQVGRVVSRQLPGLGAPTTYAYLPSGRLREEVAPTGAVHAYTYDADGQLRTEERLAAAGSTRPDAVREYTRALKRVVLVRDTEATSTLGSVTTFQEGTGYDGQGRPTRTLSPGPTAGWAVGLDGDGRLSWRSDQGRFDALAVQPALSHQYRRDAAGRLVTVEQLVGGAWLVAARYTWDSRGNLASATDAKGVTVRYRHDDFGRLVEVESPDLGLRRYLYDEAGNLAKERRPDGAILTYRHDAAGRLREVSRAGGGAPLETRTWDGVTPTLADCATGAALPASLATGRLTHVQDAAGDWWFGYWPDGRHRWEALVRPGATCARTLGWEYGADGLLAAQVYPSGARVEYRYPAAGELLRERPTSVDLVLGGVRSTLLTDLTWAQGEVTGYTTPAGAWRLTRSADGSPRQLDAVRGGTRSQAFDGFDGWGDPGSVQETVWNQHTAAELHAFGHSDLPALTQAAGPGYAAQLYAYLASGDRRGANGAAYCYETGTHRLALVAGQRRFSYHPDGSVAREYRPDGATSTWCQGPRGEVAAVVGAGGEFTEVVTSFRHQRVTERWPLNGLQEDFRFDLGSRLLAESGAASLTQQFPRPTREYVWLGAHPVAALESSEAADGGVTHQGVTYLFSGQLGEVLAEADPAGTVLRQYAFSPFGERTELPPPAGEVPQQVTLAALPGFGNLWGSVSALAGTRALRLRFSDAALAGCTITVRDAAFAWLGQFEQVRQGDLTPWLPAGEVELEVSGCSPGPTATLGVQAELGTYSSAPRSDATAAPYPPAGQRLSLVLPSPAYLRLEAVAVASCDRLEARDASGAVLWQWRPGGLTVGGFVVPDTVGYTGRLQGAVELGIWGNGCNATELKAGFRLAAILTEPARAPRPPVSLALPGQTLRSDGTADNWYRLYAPSLGRYLSPDPALLSPGRLLSAGVLGQGLAAYAYAANRPLVLVDRDGRIIKVSDKASQRLKDAIEAIKKSKCGKDLWKRLDESPIVFELGEESLGYDRGDPLEGLVDSDHDDPDGPRLPPSGTVRARVDFPNHDAANRAVQRRAEGARLGIVPASDVGEVTSDAFLVGHELAHGLDYLKGFPPLPKSEDAADQWGKCVCEGQ